LLRNPDTLKAFAGNGSHVNSGWNTAPLAVITRLLLLCNCSDFVTAARSLAILGDACFRLAALPGSRIPLGNVGVTIVTRYA
jgi:hypothetical protein